MNYFNKKSRTYGTSDLSDLSNLSDLSESPIGQTVRIRPDRLDIPWPHRSASQIGLTDRTLKSVRPICDAVLKLPRPHRSDSHGLTDRPHRSDSQICEADL